MTNVLVTGGNGQLANSLRNSMDHQGGYNFHFVDLEELDITDQNSVNSFFSENKPQWCINCAAYTAVDKAESESALAEMVNVNGAKYLAQASKTHRAKFIQISTDFVFDGAQGFVYTEKDATNPLSVYGKTKLAGEVVTINAVEEHFILRTSWLYSEHGNNFMKTMLRLGAERDELNVVTDQIGTPTYAGDLAAIILKIIDEDSAAYGLYHYSNEGVASWYDFAKAIMEESRTNCKVLPIRTEAYPTPATRPNFSVMDKTKIKKQFNIEIPHWRDSLKKAMQSAV